ncbi:MAG: type 4a pilus biogenesis protein PilO [Gammaproteobacteria bacterium]|nr:type 4a pilus biogenesis protein PilO [Gammaproteobacteria bacterium]
MALTFDDLRNIDFNDVAGWPRSVKIAAAVLICIVILAAGYWFIIKDQLAELEKAERAEVALKQEFETKKALAVNLEAYKQQMVEMQERFGVMLRQLPNRTEVPELLIDITQTGLGRGLQFDLFQPRNKRVADFYAELPVNIRVRGTYHQLGQFVSDVAALPRIVTIDDLVLSPGGGEVLTMSAVAKTYHYLDEEQVAQRQAAKSKTREKR